MKFVINKLDYFLAILFLIISISVALSSEEIEKPIHIESDIQSIDMQNHCIIFIGNVVLTQGTLQINSDKVIITRCLDKQRKKDVINGHGNPNIFYYITNKGETVKGYALKIYYDISKNYVELSGNVYFEQCNSSITGNKIIFLIKEHKILAYSGNKKRVTTTLSPSQLKKNKD